MSDEAKDFAATVASANDNGAELARLNDERLAAELIAKEKRAAYDAAAMANRPPAERASADDTEGTAAQEEAEAQAREFREKGNGAGNDKRGFVNPLAQHLAGYNVIEIRKAGQGARAADSAKEPPAPPKLISVQAHLWIDTPTPIRKFLVPLWIPRRKVTLLQGVAASAKQR
jgi:hypothetical protein